MLGSEGVGKVRFCVAFLVQCNCIEGRTKPLDPIGGVDDKWRATKRNLAHETTGFPTYDNEGLFDGSSLCGAIFMRIRWERSCSPT